MNKEDIVNMSTNRLLNLYRRYRFMRDYYYRDPEVYYYGNNSELADAMKKELDKREHLETKGRRHEKKKKHQVQIKRAKAKRKRKFDDELRQHLDKQK